MPPQTPIADSVHHRLDLSRHLLSASLTSTSLQLACELILAHDAATFALAAICQHLGRPSDKIHDSLPDYLVWLRGHARPERTPPGMDFFVELHQARIELQDRSLFPQPAHWAHVRSAVLEHIEQCTRRYLSLQPRQAPPLPADLSLAGSVSDESQRRRCPRYDCTGQAEVRIPFVGPPETARIVNLSLGGCYAEMEQPFDVGRHVEMVLSVNGLSFRATGKVVYSQWGCAGQGVPTRYENPGIGVHFTGMSSGGQNRLQELILELKAKSSP